MCTAVSYFRRFYVGNSVLHHDPRLLMLASVLLAGKTEDSFILMKDLMKIYSRYAESDILSAESLDFDLKVFHPYNCLPALISDFKQFIFRQLSNPHPVPSVDHPSVDHSSRDGGGNMEMVVVCEDPSAITSSVGEEEIRKRHSELAASWLLRAQRAVLALQVTNAILCHRPFVIALCAMKVTESEEWPRGVEAYITIRFGESQGMSILSELNSIYTNFLSTPQSNLTPDDLALQVVSSMKKLKTSQLWKR
eukprot:gene25255-33781_t